VESALNPWGDAFEWGVTHSVFAGVRFMLCEVHPDSLLSEFGVS